MRMVSGDTFLLTIGRVLCATSLLVTLASCGTGAGSRFSPGTSEPLDVVVTLDEGRAVSRVVPTSGGNILVSSADGTTYSLTIPSEALLADTEITVTPITRIVGAPIEGGRPYGVHLEPEGLRFHEPVTLEVTPPDGNARQEAASFTYSAMGEEFHGYPLALDPLSLRFQLLHFSGYVLYLGPSLEVRDPDTFMPSDWESQLEHRAQELIRAERDAQLQGEQGDPQFSQKLEAILDDYYRNVIAPLLPLIASDCETAQAQSAKVLAWTRLTHLFGLQDSFQAENEAIWNSIIAGLENCWEETTRPCVDHTDQVQVAAALSIARQLELLGAAPGEFDPLDPALSCGAVWRGTITYSEAGSITRYPDDAETTGSWTNSYEHSQTIEVQEVVFPYSGGTAELRGALRATGTISEHGLFRKEHYDDCVASADAILRYVFEDSSDFELTGEIQEDDASFSIVIDSDSTTYDIYLPINGFPVTGSRTTRHYYIDNCWPESESDDRTTEPWELAIDYDDVKATGTLGDPNHLSGRYEEQREQGNGIPTTVTVTWDLVRQTD
ncbi:MAG TPA: hypothetical protein VF168_05045 [Trueperaceae bacterium]